MKLTRASILPVTAAAVVLGVGAGVAVAAASDDSEQSDLGRLADRLESRDAFSEDVAKRLGVSAAELEQAIDDAAVSKIDEEQAAGTITSDQAATLKSALADGSLPAMRLADGEDVAEELGVTEDALDDAYSEAQKAKALARVDQLVEDEIITEKHAAELKERIEAAEFPGFGAGPGHGHHGPGMGGHGFGGHGHGLGGPGFGAPWGAFPGGEEPESRSDDAALVVPTL